MVHPRYIRQPGGRAKGPGPTDPHLPVVITPPPALTLVIATTSLPSPVVGAPYSQGVATIGTATGPLTFSVFAGALPDGLALNTTSGAITGTPTTAGAYSFTLLATASGVSDTQGYTGTVGIVLTLTITTTTLPSPVTTVAYSQTIATTGTAGAPTFSVVSGSLPAGLALAAATGAITGTPTTAGVYGFTVLASASGITDTQAYSGTVGVGLTITTNAITTPVVGVVYAQTIATAGGSGGATLTVSAGTLPAGLTLNGATGAITGTPTTPGAYSFTVLASDGVSSATKTFAGTVADQLLITATTLPTPVIGQAYSQIISTTGGLGAPTFTISSGALPAGLVLGSATGKISGTPTTPAAYNFSVRASAGGSVATQVYSGTVLALLVITTTTLPTPVVGVAYNQTIATSGGASAPVFSISAGALPAGLVLGSSTGVISGTPTVQSAYSFTVRATDGVSSPTRAFSGTVGVIIPPLTITTTTLPTPMVGAAYSQTIATAGGVAAPTFALAAGTLPVGLTLNNTTGVISGTPVSASAYSFTIRATDGTSSPTQAYSGTVAAAPPPPIAITTASLPAPVVGTPYSQTIATTGGSGAPAFSISAGALPAGLSLGAATGKITGTPTTAGAYSFTVLATAGTSATQAYSGTVTVVTPPLTITTTSLPAPVATVAYSQTVATSGGTGPPTFSVSAGALPAGLTLDTSAGTISGTATTGGAAYSFTIRATDGTSSPTQAFSGTVGVVVPPLTITTTTLPAPQVSVSYSQTIATTGGTGTPSFALSAGALPAGLSLNTATGLISGTPTTQATYSFTVRATAGTSDSQAYTVIVAAAPPPPPPVYDPMVYLARGFCVDQIALDNVPANERKQDAYTAADMAVWQSIGLTHARICISYSAILPGYIVPGSQTGQLSTATTIADFFAYIDEKAAQFIAAGLNVVFCPFIPQQDRIDQTNAGTFPGTLFQMLDLIVARYCTQYDRTQVMFELWNEPYYPNATDVNLGGVQTHLGPGYMYTDYNALYPQLIARVRSHTKGPTSHTIILDTPQSAKAEHLPFLTPPGPSDPDNNIIVSVHKYDPNALTDQGNGKPIDLTFLYPQTPGSFSSNDPKYDKNRLLNDTTTGIQLAKDWSVTHNQRIYYGEIGTTCFSDPQSRLNLFTDLIAIFKSLGIPFAIWSSAGNKYGMRPPVNPKTGAVLAGDNRNLGAPGTFYAGYDVDIMNLMAATR